MTVHFDTLQFTKTLTEAGIEPRHAEAIARAQARSLDEPVANELATKGDLAVVKAELKSDIATPRSEMKNAIAAVRSESKNEIGGLRAECTADVQIPNARLLADFRAEIKRVKRVGLISMGLFGLVAVLTELIP